MQKLLIGGIYRFYCDLWSEKTVNEKDIEDGIKEIVKERNKEKKTKTDGNERRNGDETVMARKRYVLTVTTPTLNEETAEVFRIMKKTMGFSVLPIAKMRRI